MGVEGSLPSAECAYGRMRVRVEASFGCSGWPSEWRRFARIATGSFSDTCAGPEELREVLLLICIGGARSLVVSVLRTLRPPGMG